VTEDQRREAERAERYANYQAAVAKYGLPQHGNNNTLMRVSGDALGADWTEVTTPDHSVTSACGGGWMEVSAPVRRPAAHTYAQVALSAEVATQRKVEEEKGLSDKQRKNRRKSEKAKEQSAQREVERRARLQETIQERVRTP